MSQRYTSLQRTLIRVTGKPEVPDLNYFLRKSAKYLFVVPKTSIRRIFKSLNNGQPELREGQKLLFIGGLHRSGTSLLHEMLRSHPQASGIYGTTVPEDEGQHLQSVYQPDSDYGLLFATAPGARITEESELVTNANRTSLLASWGAYWDLAKPVLLEKSPSNLIRTRFLQALFPEAAFATIVRHPIPTAIAVSKWTGASMYEICKHWLVAHQMFLEDRDVLTRSVLVRYEDLLEKPDEETRKIFDLVGLSPYSSQAKLEERSAHYFDRWETLNNEPEQILELQHEFKDLLDSLGYSFTAPYIRRGG